jgi:hypothetical protein
VRNVRAKSLKVLIELGARLRNHSLAFFESGRKCSAHNFVGHGVQCQMH